MEKNGFAEYVIANVARERNKSGWSSDRKDFLIELFHGKDISMIKPEDLIEIIQKTPRSLGSCEQIITGNRTCPSEVLDFVAEENFATIEKSNNFSFRKDNFAEGVYGKMTSGVRGIALFEIIENAPNKLLKKIFFKIKNSKKLSTGDKNSLLDYMVVRDKKVPADLLEKLLLSEFANVSAGAEIRLEKIGRQIKYKANELAHYKSLEDGVLCKQCTDYEGYSTVVIKERPPEEENV